MDNNFENVEVKESQAAELESIKELFYAGEQRLVGIKDNVVSFSCDRCEEIGTINKEGETEGHETYDWISEGIKKILSENNFKDMEFSKKDWEEYENSFKNKTNAELQEIIRNMLKKYNKNRNVYFTTDKSIISESEEKEGVYKFLCVREDEFKGFVTGNPYESYVCHDAGTEETKAGSPTFLYIPLFVLQRFLMMLDSEEKEFEITTDEVPENVREYLLNSSIFEGDEKLYDYAVHGIGEYKI